MANNFQLIPKFVSNEIGIYLVRQTGEAIMLAKIICPDDKQLGDNVALANEFLPIMRKRIKRSL